MDRATDADPRGLRGYHGLERDGRKARPSWIMPRAPRACHVVIDESTLEVLTAAGHMVVRLPERRVIVWHDRRISTQPCSRLAAVPRASIGCEPRWRLAETERNGHPASRAGASQSSHSAHAYGETVRQVNEAADYRWPGTPREYRHTHGCPVPVACGHLMPRGVMRFPLRLRETGVVGLGLHGVTVGAPSEPRAGGPEVLLGRDDELAFNNGPFCEGSPFRAGGENER